MIKAVNLFVEVLDNICLLEDFEIEIDSGYLYTIIGKNGAGKSTALKAISGDIKASKGTVYFDDSCLNQINLNEIAKKRAILSQKVTLQFDFRVHEVVALGRTPHSGFFNSINDQKIIYECLEMVDAAHQINRNYITLSGGEQQRIQIARALAQIWTHLKEKKPSYLLLDEPLANLDVAHQHEIMCLLKYLCKNNVGILTIIHDLNLAAQYADIVYVLKNGKTIAKGSPFDVFTEDIISNAFDHPMSVVPHPKIQCPLIIASGG